MPTENDAATYTREDMARAWDEGHHEGCGCDGDMNPYRVIPPGSHPEEPRR